ncbi:DUF6233 domain-containing protein [Streptomyces sp. RK75]|uniref:DUF6233 domain-containing protein n=1 Tax=Streptomyces sp. RK75 TaxID=2824895 RepID=UPI001FFC63CE|nr:DUF6233 domain-containing protein [Streptomyces sp. RK75]
MRSGWYQGVGPWARARMPDGQELDVVVVSRTRTRDGRWWYECQAILPARPDRNGHAPPAGVPVAISVAAEHIAPIPGESYTQVPAEGAVAGRQWLAIRSPGVHGGAPWWQLHHRTCWQARGGWRSRRVTTDEAREILAALPAGRLCDICRPDQVLKSAH